MVENSGQSNKDNLSEPPDLADQVVRSVILSLGQRYRKRSGVLSSSAWGEGSGVGAGAGVGDVRFVSFVSFFFFDFLVALCLSTMTRR
jgi:hypothetical protein